jgi:hypothetical protein
MLVNVAVQATIIAGYNEWRSWMLPLVIRAGKHCTEWGKKC